jgi:hypothetical protein
MSGLVGTISVSAATIGASEVKNIRGLVANTTTKATLLTPTSGKRVRLVAASYVGEGQGTIFMELYFAAGTNITTTAGNEIWEGYHRYESAASSPLLGDNRAWPDGAGPVGAVDEVITMRTDAALNGETSWILHYREE